MTSQDGKVDDNIYISLHHLSLLIIINYFNNMHIYWKTLSISWVDGLVAFRKLSWLFNSCIIESFNEFWRKRQTGLYYSRFWRIRISAMDTLTTKTQIWNQVFMSIYIWPINDGVRQFWMDNSQDPYRW